MNSGAAVLLHAPPCDFLRFEKKSHEPVNKRTFSPAPHFGCIWDATGARALHFSGDDDYFCVFPAMEARARVHGVAAVTAVSVQCEEERRFCDITPHV